MITTCTAVFPPSLDCIGNMKFPVYCRLILLAVVGVPLAPPIAVCQTINGRDSGGTACKGGIYLYALTDDNGGYRKTGKFLLVD